MQSDKYTPTLKQVADALNKMHFKYHTHPLRVDVTPPPTFQLGDDVATATPTATLMVEPEQWRDESGRPYTRWKTTATFYVGEDDD